MVSTAVTIVPARRLANRASSGESGSTAECKKAAPPRVTVAATYRRRVDLWRVLIDAPSQARLRHRPDGHGKSPWDQEGRALLHNVRPMAGQGRAGVLLELCSVRAC